VPDRTQPTLDHRRATAERNAAGIIDAAARLLAQGTSLTMRAIATEAGVSRPTLYAHYATIGEVVEASVARAVAGSLAAFKAARLDEDPADAALERALATSWEHIARYDALARGAAEHLTSAALRRSHQALVKPVRRLVERGRDEGVIRHDLPVDWLVTLYFSLVHSADEHARRRRMKRADALAMLTTTAHDVFGARRA
jgi:TetR/AcrR family transcriptional regulator, mexCD-oprJ operon repressor